MNLVDELFSVARVLDEGGIEYAVCGGIAVTLHGYTRFTKDIDLLVRPADVARLLDRVRPLGFELAANPMTFGAGTERERHVQRVTKIADGDMLTLDLLLADASYDGFLAECIRLPLEGGTIVVVSRSVLLKMKRLAARPQDLLDIDKLEHGDDG